jgi:hypothetical protein
MPSLRTAGKFLLQNEQHCKCIRQYLSLSYLFDFMTHDTSKSTRDRNTITRLQEVTGRNTKSVRPSVQRAAVKFLVLHKH